MLRPLAAALLALAARATSADTPALLLPPSLGRPDLVWVAGRVLEEAHGERGPAVVRNARALAGKNLAGAPVHVAFLGRTGHAVSGRHGEFEVALEAAPGTPFPPGEHRAVVVVPGARGEALVRVVPPDAPFLLVSDLDDTVAVTNVTSKRGLLTATFVQDADTQPAVPGMAALYRCLLARSGGPEPSLAFVSGSPVQYAPRVARFLARNGFPPGALYLRDLGPATLSGYKEPVLARLAERFPQPLVLVGDSGERDPEIYAAFAREHPGRVLAVWIRQATPDPGPPERFLGERLFADPAEVARDAASRALAEASCVEVAFPTALGGPTPAPGPAAPTPAEQAPGSAPEPRPQR
jgi:phosphatidate phosphatase APP1